MWTTVLLLAIALSAILKPGIVIVILVIALVNWVQIAGLTLWGLVVPEGMAYAGIANLPPHYNINTIEMMPVSQSFAGFQVARNS